MNPAWKLMYLDNLEDWLVEDNHLSMIKKPRMHQLREAVETVLRENIPGDFIETGVWRGGACVMMRAVLIEHNDTTRKVYLADSFQGLPKPNAAQYPADFDDQHWTFKHLAVPLEEVKRNFSPDDPQVVFLKGWFKDTLPTLDTTFAILRLDGDMYESTWDALTNLYHKLSPGGFVIIDDWLLGGCNRAVRDFWNGTVRHRWKGIGEPKYVDIDGESIYWRK